MDYKNPLHIIRDRDLSSVSPENLKRWRKELMLRFNLGGSTVIEVNGREYDREGVLAAFSKLEVSSDLEAYFYLFDKPLLEAFLEKGDLTFFEQKGAAKIIYQSDFRGKVRSLFIEKIGKIYRKTFTLESEEALLRAITLQNFIRRLTIAERTECYNLTFMEVKNVVDRLRDLSYAPFVEGFKYKLRNELSNYLNKHQCSFLEHAPEEFIQLKKEYSAYAFSIVYKIYGEQKAKTEQLSIETLKILQNAVIASLWTQEHRSNGKFLREKKISIQKAIRLKERTIWIKYGEPLFSIFRIFCLPFLFIYFLISFGIMNNEENDARGKVSKSNGIENFVDDDFWLKNMRGWYNYEYVFAGYDISEEFFFKENGRGALVIFARKSGKVKQIICAELDWEVTQEERKQFKGSWLKIKQRDTEILLGKDNSIQEKILESFEYKLYSKRVRVLQKVNPDRFFSGKKTYKSFAASDDRLLELRKLYPK